MTAALLPVQTGNIKIHRPLQVAALKTEALESEVIRRATRCKQRQRGLHWRPVALNLAQHQLEPVSLVFAPAQLAGVAPPVQNTPALANSTEQFRIRGFPPRAVKTEPLRRYRMTILQPAKAHFESFAASQLGQLPGHELGIVPGLFQPHTEMLTGTFGTTGLTFDLGPQTLGHPEILRGHLQPGRTNPLPGRNRPLQPPTWLYRSTRHRLTASSRHTA